ncbi:UNVERIFIED_CONTAM: hypothetical protein RMT77_002617 [Armadillidium vulgare]
MMSILESGLNLIKEISKIPDLKNAVITESNANVKIQGFWTIRNYAAGETNTISTAYLFRAKDDTVDELHSTFLDKRLILTLISPCGLKTAHIFQDDDCCFLNIVEGQITSTINLKNEDLHGKVYKDEILSSFCWSSDSVHLTFLAEKKRPKTSSYMSKPSEANKDGWGKKYSYTEDWGEQLTGYCQSVIVVVNTVQESVKILDLPDKIFCGEVVWTPEQELLGVGYSVEPFKLGLKYCPNRESRLFKINMLGEYAELITGEKHVQSPRFSPDGKKVVFLQNPVGGPHVRSSQLCLMDWKTKEVHVVVDYVNKSSKLEDGSLFYGFYGSTSIPQNCWSEDSKQVVVSSPDNFCMRTYLINVDLKKIRKVPLEGSTTAHDVRGKYILTSVSSLTRPPQLVLLPFISFDEAFSSKFIFVSNENSVENISKGWEDQWTFVNPNPHPVKEVSDSGIPVIYFGPTSPVSDAKRPLIVWVHGGPHSILLNKYNPIGSIFVRLGYSIVIPNYRGSLGQGKACLESLPGNCGKVDVDDVFQAVTKCLERYETVLDKENTFLYGGFLITHLSGQHPEIFRAVSARNPVVDIASMTTVTDIPDWNFVESGNTYKKGKNISTEYLKQAFEKSPMKLVDNIKTPTLILLGTEDRRVPMSPGLFYYRLLKARKIPTKLYLYDDSHALSKPDVEADAFLQTIQWYHEHRK